MWSLRQLCFKFMHQVEEIRCFSTYKFVLSLRLIAKPTLQYLSTKFLCFIFMQYLTVDILQNIRTIKNRTQYEYWWSCRSIMFSECVLLFAWVAHAEFLIDPFKTLQKKTERERIKFCTFSTQNSFFVGNESFKYLF